MGASEQEQDNGLEFSLALLCDQLVTGIREYSMYSVAVPKKFPNE